HQAGSLLLRLDHPDRPIDRHCDLLRLGRVPIVQLPSQETTPKQDGQRRERQCGNEDPTNRSGDTGTATNSERARESPWASGLPLDGSRRSRPRFLSPRCSSRVPGAWLSLYRGFWLLFRRLLHSVGLSDRLSLCKGSCIGIVLERQRSAARTAEARGDWL